MGLLLVDARQQIVDVNRAALTLLGMPREGLVGQPLASVLVPGAPADALIAVAVRADKLGVAALVHVLPEGVRAERWLQCVWRVLDDDGIDGVDSISGIARTCEIVDVTVARAADATRLREERRLQRLVANFPGVIYRCKNDPAWTMEMVGDNIEALTGYPASAFHSGVVTYGSLIVDEDRDRVWSEVQSALHARRAFQLVYRVRSKDGRRHWVWEQGAGIFADDGAVDAVEGFLSDVTDLHASEERYRAMFERNQAIKWIIDPKDGRFVDVNQAAASFYGYSKAEMLRLKITDINVSPPEKVRTDMQFAATEQRVYFEFKHKKASGEIVDVEVHTGPIELDGAKVLFSIVHDISEKKRLEDALRHAQRLEALGRLAGGVAHDFNNLMTVIVGASSLVLRDLPASSPHKERISEIAEAGKRAARLTRQLLAVGRRQLLSPQVIDVDAHIVALRGMLVGALPQNVELRIHPAPAPVFVEADPDQLEQVVLNLAINAGDAMPAGGTLTIRVRRMTFEHRDAAAPDVAPGPYAVLEVTDTGVGIDPQAMRHIFEPFYTTKPGHAGSGLGLAAVYGIVKQSGGSVTVQSAPGQGSTFRIALPAAAAPPAGEVVAPDRAGSRTAPGAHETVLVVDDDELVRRLTALMLQVQGHHVLVAKSPEDALRIGAEYEGPIDLVLTDVMMPTLQGGALVERLLQIRPELRVLFVSGYVDDIASPSLPPGTRVAFLQKPVTPEDLTAKIRALLDG